MKITFQCGQAKITIFFHNDDKDSRAREEHIDSSKTYLNKNWKNPLYKKESNKETILEYTRKRYADYIKLRKRKHKCSEEDIIFSTKGGYRENIIQIGNVNDGGPKMSKELQKLYGSYSKWHKETFPQITILTADLHMDEGTPHIQEVTSFWYVDEEDGIAKPGIDKCLEQMGIPLPNPDKKRSQKNCRESTYTAMCRDKLIEIAKEMGLEIDAEPVKGRKHLDKTNAAARQMGEIMQSMEDKIDSIFQRFIDPKETFKKAVNITMTESGIPRLNFNEELFKGKIDGIMELVEQANEILAEAETVQNKSDYDKGYIQGRDDALNADLKRWGHSCNNEEVQDYVKAQKILKKMKEQGLEIELE